MKRVILAQQLLDGTDRPPLRDPVVVVSEGRIERIFQRDQWDPSDASDHEVFDFPEATLVPGMIDGHVHLYFNSSDTTEEVLSELDRDDPVRLIATATENARLCLVGGVTTVRDCGGPGILTQQLRDAIAHGVVQGPRVLSCGMPITTTGGHCHFFGLRVDNADEARRAVRNLVQDDADWIKVMATGGRMTRYSNILQPQYSLDELRAIVGEARRLERRVASHVLNTEGIRRSVEAGVNTLEHCNWLDENGGADYDEGVLADIARNGTHVSLTIVGYMRDALRAYLKDPVASPIDPVLRSRFDMEQDMFQRGLNVFITSDAGVPRCMFDEFYLSLAVAVEWLTMTPQQAISAVTSRAALALGIEDRVGVLEAGKDADLLVVDGDPLDDILNMGRLAAVFQGGRMVSRGGGLILETRPVPERRP